MLYLTRIIGIMPERDRGGCAIRTGFPANHVASYTAYYWYKPYTYLSK